jgi:hypothetical protein
MYALQGWDNWDLLLVGDEISLLSTVNGIVKKIKFSIISLTSRQSKP